jgi:hypothetical protein
MEKSKGCFQIENISIFILTIFIFLYSLGIFIYSIFNFIDNNQYKLLIKDGNIFMSHKNTLLEVDYDYDSIYIQDNINVNFYEK